MRLILKIWVMVFAALLLTCSAFAASFTASLDRDTITLGEQATLSLKFQGSSPQSVLDLPKISGLNIGYVGRQSLDININGVPDSIVTFTYTLTPQKVGEFIVPALTVPLDGQMATTQPLTLSVQKAVAPDANTVNTGNEIAFLKLSLPAEKIYVGQNLTAQLQVFLRDDVENYGQPQFTGTPMEGFTLGKNVGGQRQQTQIGNHVYTVIPITLALTAVKSGPLTLGPFTANMTVVVGSPNQNGDPFRQFFNQGERRDLSLATETIHAEALPLPAQNRPANFNGAVGNFTMAASVGPTNVAAGDPVTVRVQISGRGSLDSVTLPDQTTLSGFKIFPPTVKTELSGQLGLDGTKTFEEIVTPQNSDVREWPPFSFSFFNPDDGQYHTLTQAAVPLTIKAVSATPLPALAKTATTENQTPPDILPLKQNLGTLAQIPVGQNSVEPLIAKPGFLALQSLPVLAFLAALVWRKRADNLANNPRLRRKLAVAQIISSGLNDLKKFAAENKPDEFFALLFRLLQEQLGERLDCPATAITENVVEENPLLRNAPNSTRDGLRELFQLCNQARYAPVRGTAELNSVAAQLQKTLGELQNLKT
jgi:BatD DUF11 like domain